MADKNDNQKEPADLIAPADESSQEEMQILKQILDAEEPIVADEQLFAADLFAAPEEKEKRPKQEEPAASASEPVPEPREQTPPEPAAESESQIKIVTDDDLKSLFEETARPAEPEAPAQPKPPPELKPPAQAKPPPEPEARERTEPRPPEELDEPSPAAEEVEEIGLEPEPPEPASDEPPPVSEPEPAEVEELEPLIASGPEPTPTGMLSEISPDDIVEHLEERAVVGEMTTVAAAKKGELLEKTRQMVSRLEPSGTDYLNVAELKKLFNNVNILIELVTETSERLEALEDLVRELSTGGGKK